MRKNTRNFVFASAFLMTFLAMAPGCTKTGSTLTTSPVTYLSLINEATYTAPVSVLLNDTTATVSGGIAAGSFSSKYGTIRPGNYDVKFKVASSDSLLSEIPLAAYDTLNFYTLIVYNTPGGHSANAVRIWDDFSTISTTQANYRFFNLCPDYPNVDLYLNTTQLQNNRTTGDNATNTLLGNFQPVANGVYTISAKVAGTDSVIASVSQVGLNAGNAYTLFLSGNKNSTNYPLTLNVLQAAY
ncbi:MAG TPA: DUF4397 domain-containing protein [Puia sp.]|nr:DUF4397 domain-containing protein [Puia sp.]